MGVGVDQAYYRPERKRRQGEFHAQWKLEADVRRAAMAGGALAVAVWAAIRAWAGTRARLEGPAAPTVGALAGELFLGERTVQRKIQELEDAGLLRVGRRVGRKPIWLLSSNNLNEAPDPRSSDGGQPVENSQGPPSQLRGTPVTDAGDPRSSDTPAPPLEKREKRERKAVGDDELRKTKTTKLDEQGSAAELEQLVHRFSGLMVRLLAEAPDSPDHLALEELVLDARDVTAWRALVETAETAVRLSPHLQRADA